MTVPAIITKLPAPYLVDDLCGMLSLGVPCFCVSVKSSRKREPRRGGTRGQCYQACKHCRIWPFFHIVVIQCVCVFVCCWGIYQRSYTPLASKRVGLPMVCKTSDMYLNKKGGQGVCMCVCVCVCVWTQPLRLVSILFLANRYSMRASFLSTHFTLLIIFPCSSHKGGSLDGRCSPDDEQLGCPGRQPEGRHHGHWYVAKLGRDIKCPSIG